MRSGAPAVLLVIALAGCSSGSSPTQPPPPPPPVISFLPAGGQGDQAIFLSEATGATATTISLLLQCSSVSGLYGVAFELNFPATALALVTVEEGDFLSDQPTSFQTDTSQDGRLIVGLSRIGNVAGQDGSGTLIRLEFAKIAPGTGATSFDRNVAFGSQGEDRFEITWSGGTVIVP